MDILLTREQRYRHNAAAMARCTVPTPQALLGSANSLHVDLILDYLAVQWLCSGLKTL